MRLPRLLLALIDPASAAMGSPASRKRRPVYYLIAQLRRR
jgi:hypothetical protein